jgi:hypothetical protein
MTSMISPKEFVLLMQRWRTEALRGAENEGAKMRIHEQFERALDALRECSRWWERLEQYVKP